MNSILHLNLLGGMELAQDGVPYKDLRSQKAVALLIYLACNPGPQRREFLADLLWDASSTKQSLSNLRTVLTRLRRHLDGYLHVAPQTLTLAPDAKLVVDVVQFEAGTSSAPRQLSPQAAAQLESALACYRGDFLAGFHPPDASAFEHWLITERERLRFLAQQGYRRLTNYWLDAQAFPAAIRAAAAWLRLDPLDEEAHARMMRLLVFDGQPAAALAHYRNFRQQLQAELDVAPGDPLQELYQQISDSALQPPAPPVADPAPARHNLPHRLTSFLGREQEIETVRNLFAAPTTRLVTLAGEGGVGKSALALALGHELLDALTPEIFFVPLAEVAELPAETLPNRLAAAVARAVGLSFAADARNKEPLDQLFHFLQARTALLILDNCEHLPAVASFVSAVLQAAPDCRVLATSRLPLHLSAESVVRLDGLPVPPEVTALPLPDEMYPGVALFLQRARQRQFTFSVSGEERLALNRLCRLVAGNPLALELAAAWVEHFRLAEMAEQLQEQMLDFLHAPQPNRPPRHHSLRRVMETSWRLLSPAGQRVLARLSCFRGSFPRGAAQAVADASLDVLVELADSSLLQQPTPGQYALHEMVRQFAAEQLQAAGPAAQETAQRHAQFYLALVGRVERTPDLIPEVSAALANVRAAWNWAVENQAISALADAGIGLWNFYLRAGLFQEAEEAFGRAIAAVLSAPPGTPGRQRALASLRVAQAVFFNIRRRYADAIAVAEEAIQYALQEENEELIARGYLQWGTGLLRQGRYSHALVQLRMALMAAEDAGLAGDEADILGSMGTALLEQDKFEEANDCLTRALEQYQQQGNRLGEGNILTTLGWLHQRQQKQEQARVYFEAAGKTHTAIDNSHGSTMALINLASVFQAQGDFSAALDAYRQVLSALDTQPDDYQRSLANFNLALLLSRMGEYAAARGHVMTSLAIDRATGDRGGQAWAYNALGLLHNRLGDYKTGLAWHRQALQLGQEIGAGTIEGLAQLGMGQDLHGLGQWQEARRAYEKAIAVQASLNQQVWVVESRSWLALTLLALDEPDAAFAQIEEILAYLQTGSLDGAREPSFIYWHCYCVLRAVEDPRASQLLGQVWDFIQRQASRISDPSQRWAYLYGIAAHRQIVAEVQALGIPHPV